MLPLANLVAAGYLLAMSFGLRIFNQKSSCLPLNTRLMVHEEWHAEYEGYTSRQHPNSHTV